MRRLIFCLILFYGCTPGIHFTTPNEVYKEKATLWMRDKSKLTGMIIVSLESNTQPNFVYKPFIEFVPEETGETKHINLSDISGYSIGTDFYALKKVDMSMDNVNHLLFVKRLTREDSKLQLYELHESGRSNPTGESRYSYFLSLPSSAPLETVNTKGVKVVPLFDLKMSAMVADCPQLATKIRMKEEGYFLPMMSFSRKKQPEVLLRIINEYDSCK